MDCAGGRASSLRQGLNLSLALPGWDQCRRALGNRQDRGVRIGGDDHRHHRCVCDAQSFDPPHPELGVDDGLLVGAHAAGTHGVKVGACRCVNVCTASVVVERIGIRAERWSPPSGERFRVGELLGPPHARHHQVKVT
jgi:hypothetical protein